MQPDYYQILGISKNADDKTIKLAFRQLALRWHPDRNPGNNTAHQQFQEISEAYQVLTNKTMRRDYDLKQEYSDFHSSYYGAEEASTTYSRYRHKPPPPGAYRNPTGKKEFTRKAYIMAYGTVALIIIIAVILPVTLNMVSSEVNYNKGLEFYEEKDFQSAVDHFVYATRDFGTKNVEASLMIAHIMIFELKNYSYALGKINTGLKYCDAEQDSLRNELHFLKGICLQHGGRQGEARDLYMLIKDHDNHYDSAQLNLGIILTVTDSDYKSGEQIFQQLIDRSVYINEAQYYMAMCLQHQDKHKKALSYYTELYKRGYEIPSVLYHRALSNIKLKNRKDACDDLGKASRYNLMEARKLYRSYCFTDSIL